MSIFNSHLPIMSRGGPLASVAAVAITASLAVGGSMLSTSTPSIAAVLDTAALQTSGLPSFAAVVDRVKPAVVSVKVDIEDAASRSDDLTGPTDNVPPDAQQFFKRHGEQDGGAAGQQER
jgi:serine protease Do